jgi:hypothetical protein
MTLHARSRGTIVSTVLVGSVAAVLAALERWASFNRDGEWGAAEELKQFAVVLAMPALIAAVTGISVWSPFGEPERSMASSLARLRAAQVMAVLLPGSILALSALATWPQRSPEIDLTAVAVRNIIAMVGIALLVGRLVDARWSWLAPMTLALLPLASLPTRGEDPLWHRPWWAWCGQSQDSMWAWSVAIALAGAGAFTFLAAGPRDVPGDDA